MEGRLQLFPAALLVMMLLLSALLANGGVRGNDVACEDKMRDCRENVNAASHRFSTLLTASPRNVTAVVTQCQAMEQEVASCVADLPTVCDVTPSFNSSLESLRSVYNSACGPETLCQLRECMTSSQVSEITSLLGQKPPNAQQLKEKCSAFNATRTPCMEQLKADCGSVGSMSFSIKFEERRFDNLCGQVPMCQAQSARCSALFRPSDPVQLCSAKQAVRDCIAEIDPICHTLPDIQRLNASLSFCPDLGNSTASCPQLLSCVGLRATNHTDPCSMTRHLMSCVEKLRDTCPIKEDYLTFQEVETLSHQFCQEMFNGTRPRVSCPVLSECVMGSKPIRKIWSGINSDSQIWCQFLEVASGCFMKSNSSCRVDPTLLSYMTRQHNYLNTACYSLSSGAYCGKAALGNSILILLLAVLTTWAQSFL